MDSCHGARNGFGRVMPDQGFFFDPGRKPKEDRKSDDDGFLDQDEELWQDEFDFGELDDDELPSLSILDDSDLYLDA